MDLDLIDKFGFEGSSTAETMRYLANYEKNNQDEEYVQYIADRGPNSCNKCNKNHLKIFRKDDPDKPKIPVHPNCRCNYVRYNQNNKKNYKIVTTTNLITNEINTKINDLYKKSENILNSCSSFLQKANQDIANISHSIIDEKITQWNNLTNEMKKSIESLDSQISKYDFIRNELNFSEIINLKGNLEEIYYKLKEIHYLRLKVPEQLISELPKSPKDAINKGFIKASNSQNMYHRHKGEIFNTKYYHPKTGQEVIFDSFNNIVTDPENTGTKNYGSEPISVKHVVLDVLPYWIWGNSPDDSINFIDRVKGSK